MKLAPSSHTLAILFIAILAVSLVNTFFIYYSNETLQKQRNQDLSDVNQSLNQTYVSLNQTDTEMRNLLNGKIDNVYARLPIGQYNYVVYRYWDYKNNVSVYLAKNGRTGVVEFNSTDASLVLNGALQNANSVYVVSDDYNLTSDVCMANKKNARLDSDGATLLLFGNRVVINGTDFTRSQYNQISGFIVFNGTVRIQNSFRTTVTNMIFENCTVGLELANTNTWTEATRIDTIHFSDCVQGLVFRTNITDPLSSGFTGSTGSYGNTELSRCYFNQLDNSVAITLENRSELTDSCINDVRVWIGEFGRFNQTGLLMGGSMFKTVINNIVFESFASLPLDNASIYAISIQKSSYQMPIFESAVNFLGAWTARVNNPDNAWIFGVGGVFRRMGFPIPVGTGDYGATQIIQAQPATIATFTPKINVQGSFGSNESITVRIRLEYVDNGVSSPVEKMFNSTGSVWLTNDDLLQLYASQNVIYAIMVDAKSSTQTDATVAIDVFGTTA
jgi:hypothetical protein